MIMQRKSLITAVITCLFFIVFSNANAQTSFGYYAKETLDAVGASVEQQQKALELQRTYNDKVRATRKDPDLTDTEKEEKVKSIRNERNEKYFELFMPEQQEHLKKLRREFYQDRKSKQ